MFPFHWEPLAFPFAQQRLQRAELRVITRLLCCPVPQGSLPFLFLVSPSWNWNLGNRKVPRKTRGKSDLFLNRSAGGFQTAASLSSVSGMSHGGYCNIRGILTPATAAKSGSSHVAQLYSLSPKNLTFNLPLLQTWCILPWHGSK